MLRWAPKSVCGKTKTVDQITKVAKIANEIST